MSGYVFPSTSQLEVLECSTTGPPTFGFLAGMRRKGEYWVSSLRRWNLTLTPAPKVQCCFTYLTWLFTFLLCWKCSLKWGSGHSGEILELPLLSPTHCSWITCSDHIMAFSLLLNTVQSEDLYSSDAAVGTKFLLLLVFPWITPSLHSSFARCMVCYCWRQQ